jgi:hypothetical protein
MVSVEVLVRGVMLDLTLNLPGHQAVARLRVPSLGPTIVTRESGSGQRIALRPRTNGAQLATSSQLGQ